MVNATPSPSAWFKYPVRVQPHHTDYGGVVWHGTYITWMESARIECLRAAGAPFEHLVELGYDLPVVDLEVRYRRPLMLGDEAIVKTRLAPVKGVRIQWLYEIETDEVQPQLCLSGQITLVTVDVASRKVMRRLPEAIAQIIHKAQQKLPIS